MQKIFPMLLLAALSLAAGCAAHRMTLPEQRAQFLRYAGEPVRQITYLGRYDNWRALGDDAVVVWTTFNKAYLLKLSQPCTGLQFAHRIGLSSTGGSVTQGLDSVRFEHGRCFIDEIRPIDTQRMRADERTARQKAPKDA